MNTEKKRGALPYDKAPLLRRLKQKGIIRPYTVTVAAVFLFAVIIYTVSRFFVPFAEFWARYPSQGIRMALGTLTGWIPFSLAETFVISLPVLAAAFVIYSNRKMAADESARAFWGCIMPIVSFMLIIASIFLLGFGPCYFRRPLEDNLGLDRSGVTAQRLYDASEWLCTELDGISDGIAYRADGLSAMPYSYYELSAKMNDAFAEYASKADYISSFRTLAKPVVLSEPMTYTHISGVYTFFTGEANVNVNYPDFNTPFTMAHEMAHQRGIAREDEANFVAFLVCMESDDEYIRYSALTNMLQYMGNALYSADSSLYSKLYGSSYPDNVKAEFRAYSLFFDKYRDSGVSNVVENVNDTFLGSQGQTHGTKSYGLVVELFTSYYDIYLSQS